MTEDDKRHEEEHEGELRVKDKRRFTTEGEPREPDEDSSEVKEAPKEEQKESPKEEPKEAPKEEPKEPPKEEPKETAKESRGPLPTLDFATFVLSLATSAQVHLGIIPNPGTGKQECDLPLAKQTIDMLGILQDKTKGNLTDEEGRLLEHVLYDLRMKYMELEKQQKK